MRVFAATSGQRMVLEGNQAVALSALAAGCTFYASYPTITPATAIGETLARQLSANNGFACQAEDEIAALGAAVGASFCGAKAMTATFVSRTFAGSQKHMQMTISQAFDHSGFSFVEIIAPCRTFDRSTSLTELSPNTVDLNRDLHHNPTSKEAALNAAVAAMRYDRDAAAQIPIGIFWESAAPTFEEHAAAVKTGDASSTTLNAVFEKYSL